MGTLNPTFSKYSVKQSDPELAPILDTYSVLGFSSISEVRICTVSMVVVTRATSGKTNGVTVEGSGSIFASDGLGTFFAIFGWDLRLASIVFHNQFAAIFDIVIRCV